MCGTKNILIQPMEDTADIKFAHMNYGGCHILAGAASREIFEPNRKLLPAPPNFEKNIALAFLKAAWLQIPYWVHFTFKV